MIAQVPETVQHSVGTVTSESNRVIAVCRIVCILLAVIETWSQRNFLNEDGVSYLDMSDWLVHHNWHLLLNGIWSPLYPSLLGICTWLAHPLARWEIPLVHGINLLIFVVTMASFEFLLHGVISLFRREDSANLLPVWVWQILGYSFFIWASVGMIWAPWMIAPDMCVAAFVYLNCGLVLRLNSGKSIWRNCLLLGLTLGFGYFAKAILFPLAFLFLAMTFFAMRLRRKPLLPLVVGSLIFGAISAPLLVAMSMQVGKLSYSEVGSLNYAWHVNHVSGGKLAGGPFYPAELGPPAYLKHPVKLLYAQPEVYGFREPLAFTYGPRSDWQYWCAGTPAVFNARNQILAIVNNVQLLFRDPHILPLWVLILIGSLVILVRPSVSYLKSVRRAWPLIIPGVIGTCLYLLISVEPRYVAPFFVVVLLGLFPAALRRGSTHTQKRVSWPVAVASGLTFSAALLVAYHWAGYPHEENGNLFLKIGTSLNEAGVQPGTNIGIIGDSSAGCRWARLARVHVVAQMLREDAPRFWQISDPAKRVQVYAAFARGGAEAIVAEQVTPSDGLAGWQQLGNSNYYVHFLVPTSANAVRPDPARGQGAAVLSRYDSP